jgi:hypothetical protein
METKNICSQTNPANGGDAIANQHESGAKGGAAFGMAQDDVAIRQVGPNPKVMALLEKNIKENAATWRELAKF